MMRVEFVSPNIVTRAKFFTFVPPSVDLGKLVPGGAKPAVGGQPEVEPGRLQHPANVLEEPGLVSMKQMLTLE